MSSEIHILLVFLAAGIAAALFIGLLGRKSKSSGAKPAASMSEFIPCDQGEAIAGERHPQPAMSESGQGEKIRDSAGVSTGLVGESGVGQEQDTGAAMAKEQAAGLEPKGEIHQEGEEQPGGRAEQHGDRRADSVAISADKQDQGMAASTGFPNSEPVDTQDKEAAATIGAKEREEGTAIGAGSDAVPSGAPGLLPFPAGTNAEAARAIPKRGSSAEEAGRPEEDKQGDIRNDQAVQEPAEHRLQQSAASTARSDSGETELKIGVAAAPPSDIEVAGRAAKRLDMPEEAGESAKVGPVVGGGVGAEPRAAKTETADASVQTARSSEKQTSPETAGSVESGGTSERVVEAGPKRAPEENQQHEPPTGKERVGLDSEIGTLPRTPRKRRSRKRRPRKYRGLSREAPEQREAVPRQDPRDQLGEFAEQRRSLPIEVRIRFERGGFCRVSLIAKRSSSSPEDLTAFTSSGEEVNLRAMQDEWYQDFVPDDLSRVLRDGIVLTAGSANGQYQWLLSGREIYVLAARPDISGYVSQACLELGREHVVLCTAEVRDRVEKAIRAARAQPSTILDESSGAPPGWLIFGGVVPASPVSPEGGLDIFNALRPLPDIKISLEGGIRLERGKWLEGHPPSIRVYGSVDTPEVRIDGRLAKRTGDGAYYSDGWNSVGGHSVWCGGKSCSYSIVPFEASWELFEAYTFPIAPGARQRFSLCGPVVQVGGVAPSGSQTICVPETNSVVLGREPGQIAMAFKASPVPRAPCIATPSFPPVWAAPADPLHCDKESTRILYVARLSPAHPAVQPVGAADQHKDIAIERWYRLVLDSSRKGIGLYPDTEPVRELWQKYKNLARRVWRAIK